MIRQTIDLERAHGWRVTCYYAVTHYEVEEIMQGLIDVGCEGENLQTAYDNLSSGSLNTGLCYSGKGESVLVISCASSPAQFLNSLVHELHHLASHIASALGYDQKGEEACYIAGETAERMYKVANKFLCEHCRKH